MDQAGGLLDVEELLAGRQSNKRQGDSLMRSIKIGLALVAALVVGVAMTGSASAALSFLTTLSKAALLSEGVQEQVFKTKAGEVKCNEAKIEAGLTGTAGKEELVQLVEIHYSGKPNCLAFGFVPTELKNADYLFLPDGTVHIDNEIKIVASTCEVQVPPQLVGSIKYTNTTNSEKHTNIKIEPNVTGILYTAKGCTMGNGEFKDGTYTGNAEAMIAGGSISFMP
jgi:uncharacterized low-complexity protein